ncbi:MAG: hypothetical protein R3E94_02665 [Burkholderiaceae bacterium]
MAGPPEQATSSTRYTVTTYLAYPGTPLKDGDGNLSGETSAAGHMWYRISDGTTKNSYGFAPKEHGQSSGPGEVVRTDTDAYHQPGYSRTLEISAEQYQRLKQYGEDGYDETWRYFRSDYHGLTNSCIDFTWGALKYAGIERHQPAQTWANDFGLQETPAHDRSIDRGFDGAVKVLSNQHHVQQLVPPMPASELNQERSYPAPPRSLMQRLFSETGMSPSQLDPISRQLLADSERHVRQVAQMHQLPWDAGMDNTVHAMAERARASGLTAITHFRASGGTLRLAQFDGYGIRETTLDARIAANTPAHRSLVQLLHQDRTDASVAQAFPAFAAQPIPVNNPKAMNRTL